MTEIELMDLEVIADASAWRAHLVVDGLPICRLAGGGEELVVLSWFQGCGPEDLAALEDAIAANGVARTSEDGATRPDTLIERCADIVADAIIHQALQEAMGGAVLFTVPSGSDGDVDLLTVPVPEGGTRQGAIDHVRSLHPGAVVLNELPLDEAVDAYLAGTATGRG